MKPVNTATIEFLSRSANEGFARTAAACFAAQLDPTLDEINDIKTAVSEAVTNAIVHAYPDRLGRVKLKLRLFEDSLLEITVQDWGVGIADVAQARTPLFTTGNEERSGMGFTIMESFMDTLRVRSTPGKGTTVTMRRRIARRLTAGGKGVPWRPRSRRKGTCCWLPPGPETTTPVNGCWRRTPVSSGASCGDTMAAGWTRRTCTSWGVWVF